MKKTIICLVFAFVGACFAGSLKTSNQSVSEGSFSEFFSVADGNGVHPAVDSNKILNTSTDTTNRVQRLIPIEPSCTRSYLNAISALCEFVAAGGTVATSGEIADSTNGIERIALNDSLKVGVSKFCEMTSDGTNGTSIQADATASSSANSIALRAFALPLQLRGEQLKTHRLQPSATLAQYEISAMPNISEVGWFRDDSSSESLPKRFYRPVLP